MFILVAETCKCERNLYTNFFMVEPYIFLPSTSERNITGVFPDILKNLLFETCGVCNGIATNYSTNVNFMNNGKGAFSRKRNIDRVLDDIDQFTQVSFPLTSAPKENSLESVFVPIMKYPGGIYIVKKPDVEVQVKLMAVELLRVLPILFMDFLFIMLAGMIIWALVSISTPLSCSKELTVYK